MVSTVSSLRGLTGRFTCHFISFPCLVLFGRDAMDGIIPILGWILVSWMTAKLVSFSCKSQKAHKSWVQLLVLTGLGSHSLLRGIFPTQGSNPSLLYLLLWQADPLPLSHDIDMILSLGQVILCVLISPKVIIMGQSISQNYWVSQKK